MRSRCAAGFFHRSAVFSCRICFLVHLTIRPPESDRQSESYRAIKGEPQKDPKPLDSISYGSGIINSRRPGGRGYAYAADRLVRLERVANEHQLRVGLAVDTEI